jgi:hypothetical protein
MTSLCVSASLFHPDVQALDATTPEAVGTFTSTWITPPLSIGSSLKNNMIVTEIPEAARRSAESGRTVYLK